MNERGLNNLAYFSMLCIYLPLAKLQNDEISYNKQNLTSFYCSRHYSNHLLQLMNYKLSASAHFLCYTDVLS